MAMTKKEKAEFDALLKKVAINGAFHFTPKNEPDLAPPKDSLNDKTNGWLFNSYNETVYQAWSSSVSHGTGVFDKSKGYYSASQGSRWLYSTRELALKALRNELEQKFASSLAKIDLELAQGEIK